MGGSEFKAHATAVMSATTIAVCMSYGGDIERIIIRWNILS